MSITSRNGDAAHELDARFDPYTAQRRYQTFVASRVPSGADLYRQRISVGQLRYRPLVSIVMPVYNTPPEMLRRMLTCIARQTYPHWQLCVVDDGSTEPWIASHLSRLAARDPRIRFRRRPANGGISAATNDGIAMATGDFVTFVDHDDEIDPRLLYAAVRHLNAQPSTDALHSDIDHMLPGGGRLNPLFGPAWSPELLLAVPYVVHLVVRRACLEAIGELRTECDGGQDYDLALRLAEVTTRIHHLPEVLYHWRIWSGSASSGAAAKPYAFEARKRAVRDALRRRGVAARCVDHAFPELHRVVFDIAGEPLVSVIVPVAHALPGSIDDLAGRLQRLAHHSAYRRFEMIVTGAPAHAASIASRMDIPAGVPVRTVTCDADDRGVLVNRGAAMASGDHLLVLAPGLEAADEHWMSSLIEYAQQEPIGVVGAQINGQGDTVWHAGVHVPQGTPVALKRDILLHPPGSRHVLNVANLSAVSGACLMTRRDVFDAAGGFRSDEAVGFADVDYCLRVREGGRRIVFTPFARLHAPALPRLFPSDGNDAFRRHWGHYSDPYYNPNLSPDGLFLPIDG